MPFDLKTESMGYRVNTAQNLRLQDNTSGKKNQNKLYNGPVNH